MTGRGERVGGGGGRLGGWNKNVLIGKILKKLISGGGRLLGTKEKAQN